MKQLRTVLAGLGRVGWPFHFPNLRTHHGFLLTAVADPNATRLEEARKVARDLWFYDDFASMIEEQKPELVVIASPTIFHMEQVEKAFLEGADVFLEKPMAVDLAQADRMIKLMRQNERKLMVYQPHRARALAVHAKRIIQSGVLGPLHMIKYENSAFRFRSDWQSLKKFGGGMLNNYGAHYIDLLLYLSGGNRVEQVESHLRSIASAGDADDVVKCLMRSDNGVILDLDINMAAAVSNRPLIVYGKYGTLWQEGEQLMVKRFDPSFRDSFVIDEHLAAKDRKYDLIGEPDWIEQTVELKKQDEINFYDECYAYFAQDEKPFVDVEETREVMRIIHECKKQSDIWT